MRDRVLCRALRAVRADRLYRPGETLELELADAELLVADGAVRLLKRRPARQPAGSGGPAPSPGTGGATPPREPGPAAPEPTGAEGAPEPEQRVHPAAGAQDPRPTTFVTGIGAATAAKLAERGIDSIGALAALSDAELQELAGHVQVIGDEVAALTDWRSQARSLMAAEHDGERADPDA